jgi:phosphoribosylglycinamide formyltransferase-1
MPGLNLGFLASHGGSNMQAIIDACNNGKIDAKPCVVISNNSGSYAIERARAEGIPFEHISSKTHPGQGESDRAILNALRKYDVNLVVLAGYMKKIGKEILEAYEGRIINIHPALLPKFGGDGMFGMNVHRAVIESGETESGCTVHVVDEIYDHGRILNQKTVQVLSGDTPESLAERVLEQEHLLYPDTIGKIANGEITV